MNIMELGAIGELVGGVAVTWNQNPNPFSRDFTLYVETLLRRSKDLEVLAREGS